MSLNSSEQSDLNTKQSLAVLLRHVAKLLSRMHHSQDHHAQHAQHKVYSVIKERGPIKQRQLLEIFDVRSSSLSEVLQKLERNGLIRRERDESDRRGFVLMALDQENDLAKPEVAQHSYQDSDLFECLSTIEQQKLSQLLQKIVGSAKEKKLMKHGCQHGKEQYAGEMKHKHKSKYMNKKK